MASDVTCRMRVAGECDCGREVATWVEKTPEQLAGSTVRVVCGQCDAVVHTTSSAPRRGEA